jgi:hypothetical protein
MKFFHQYGARRSGTNYTQALLEENFEDVIVLSKLFWKHDKNPGPNAYKKKLFPDYPSLSSISYSAIESEFFNNEYLQGTPPWRTDKYNPNTVHKQLMAAAISDNVHTMINIKNPYAWICSMLDWATRTRENPETDKYIFFRPLNINKSMRTCDIKITDGALEQSIESYNERYRYWLNHDVELIKYEDILLDHESVLKRLESKYGLNRRNSFLSNIRSGCDPSPQNRKDRDRDWNYTDYYLNQRYLDRLGNKVIDDITQNVDWELLKPLGYVPI